MPRCPPDHPHRLFYPTFLREKGEEEGALRLYGMSMAVPFPPEGGVGVKKRMTGRPTVTTAREARPCLPH